MYYRTENPPAIWSVADACYVEEAPAGAEVRLLITAAGESDAAHLARTLEFYGHPLGELGLQTEKGVKAALAALDAQYLTPRTLAGLAEKDPTAMARWREHEEKAEVLRARLGEMAGQGE